MELSATNSGFNNLTLNWRLGNGAPVTLQQRLYNPTNPATWTTLASNYLPYRYTTNLTLGQRYEYKAAGEYLLTAVAGTPTETRGKAILIVATNIMDSLTNELAMLQSNLVGDGWTVVRTNVPPHNDSNWTTNTPVIASIKGFITNVWRSSPYTNLPGAILLIGHVPTPHSGFLNPDGHGARCLPADGFYGDVDGVFADSTSYGACALANTCPCDFQRHGNYAGDGKWDSNRYPANSQQVSALEIPVGRIDCSNLSSFASLTPPLSEIDLLRQYLNKNDQYRRKTFSFPPRLMLGAYFDQVFDQAAAIVWPAIRTGTRLFGFAPTNIINGDGISVGNGATWVVNAGFGATYHMQGSNSLYHAIIPSDSGSDSSILRPGATPQSGFYNVAGSCFMDFPYGNNFMRGLMAVGTTANMGVMWFPPSDMPLAFERIALGETVGSEFMRTVNESTGPNTHVAWIGDPTLRVQILKPAINLQAATNSGNVNLTWTGSSEASQYFVYRSQYSLNGPFPRLSSTAVSGTSFTDTSAPTGTNTYMVRALALTTTASGSYTNLSQGTFVTIIK